ncbi:hypothetical protein H9P43_007686 [Blastocladiella emersonii ATCC 22665]|nr:hypothetical protein H9P43_007686 [Blastocladiella emersonii ATCC 22665]
MLPLAATASLTAVSGGIVSILVSVAIEKFGGILGGVIGSVPHGVVPASIGFWLQFRDLDLDHGALLLDSAGMTLSGLKNFQKSMASVPIGMMINSFYLLLWRVLPTVMRRRYPDLSLYRLLTVVFLITITLWVAFAAALVGLFRAILPPIDVSVASSSDDTPVLAPDVAATFFIGVGCTAVQAAVVAWIIAVITVSLPSFYFLRWRRSLVVMAAEYAAASGSDVDKEGENAKSVDEML